MEMAIDQPKFQSLGNVGIKVVLSSNFLEISDSLENFFAQEFKSDRVVVEELGNVIASLNSSDNCIPPCASNLLKLFQIGVIPDEPRDDWEEPVAWFIRNDATKDELEAIAGMEIEDDLDATREGVLETVEDFEEVGREYNLDPYVTEIYEHWIVDRYFYQALLAEGQIVFEFGGMLIWGRTTTGQSISLDGVIRRMTRELPDDHWIFWDEK